MGMGWAEGWVQIKIFTGFGRGSYGAGDDEGLR